MTPPVILPYLALPYLYLTSPGEAAVRVRWGHLEERHICKDAARARLQRHQPPRAGARHAARSRTRSRIHVCAGRGEDGGCEGCSEREADSEARDRDEDDRAAGPSLQRRDAKSRG